MLAKAGGFRHAVVAGAEITRLAESRFRLQEDYVYEQILYDVNDPVATVTLNRPDRLNAWTERIGIELKHALAQAEADPAVVAIVLTGAGRGFCAGADMRTLKSISDGDGGGVEVGELAADPGDPALAGFRQTYTYLMSLRKPVIAAINGPVAGMAVPIVLACDLRFASDRAIFTTAFVRRGLIAEWGISWLLPRLVGTGHALDLLFSGRRFDAAEAERIGLVNRVLPHDELLDFATGYVRDMAANCSPASLQIMKRQVYQALEEPLSEAHAKAVRLMIESFGRKDFAEGVDSYLEKRPPRFPRL
ncbi:MAG: enoyl-CoA hydratase [Myxococcales bacterium]|nr:enoyl-CoA hydratase [Myxococcales bacterium]